MNFQAFNEDQLVKIKKSISGRFRKSTRAYVVLELNELSAQIREIRQLPKAEQKLQFIALMDEAAEKRHQALDMGARSCKDPYWAAAAACETWMQTLVFHESGGIDDADLSRIEGLIDELRVWH